MKTEVNTDVAQLTDDQIDAVGGAGGGRLPVKPTSFLIR